MVETISPVGYGDRRGRWLAAVALHALGATAAAAAFGAVLGVIGSALGLSWGPAVLASIAIVAAAYAAREMFGLPVPVPAARRQVPDWWRSFFSWPVAAVLYGAGLGIGFLTFLANGGLVVVASAALATGRPTTAAVLSGAFGLARGLSPLVAWPVRSSEAGTALVDRLAASDPTVWRRLNAGALGLVALTAIAVWPRTPVPGPAGAMRTGLMVLASALLAGTFGWAGVTKLVDRRGWRRTLAGYALPAAVRRTVGLGVPLAELGVPAAVLLGSPRAGARLALVLLAAFSLVILRTRVRGGSREITCGCFGGATARDFRLLLGRNAVLAAAAVASAGAPASPMLHWPGSPGEGELLPFLLAVTGCAVALFTGWRTELWLGRGRRA
jgi:Methylamine utilisation protein MauE